MSTPPIVVLPVRNFRGMSRLSVELEERERSELLRTLCELAINASMSAGLETVVVTSSSDVEAWATQRSVQVVRDTRTGLSNAVSGTVEALDDAPWIVLLPDLPLVSADALMNVAHSVANGTVLVPSQDGGTNVIAGTGPFPFQYGPGSFHRHFASRPDAHVISRPELSIDIDSPAQLAAFPDLVSSSTMLL